MTMTSTDEMPDPDHHRFDVGDVSLHAVIEGDGQPVLLLHGFPEFWYSWRFQLPALAKAGFRAIAPDLRGYNESDRPEGVEHYELEKLAADIAGLAGAVAAGGKRVHLVGHDWGGVIAWAAAHLYPELFGKLVILNAPHPSSVLGTWLRYPAQLLRSWYVFFFLLPWAPERAILKADFLARALRGWSRRKERAFTDEDLQHYEAALHQPGAASAAINYYRAAMRQPFLTLPGRIARPTMVIWAEDDRALGTEFLGTIPRYVSGPLRIERIPDASHWVQHDAPERVNALLLEFLQGP